MFGLYGKNRLYGEAWRITLKLNQKSDVEFLRPAYKTPPSTEQIEADIKKFKDELINFNDMRQAVEQNKQYVRPTFENLVAGDDTWVPLLYFLIRIQQPEIVVETGCATGTTAALILHALELNNKGHLHSIDLRFPTDWISQNNLKSGFLVPENLKHRWTFYDKELKTALPELLGQLGRVDFFYHDSDHSYYHQMWEYLTAWPYLSIGGIMASDDLYHNTAFFDFIRQVPERLNITNRGRNFGMVVKQEIVDVDHATIGSKY